MDAESNECKFDEEGMTFTKPQTVSPQGPRYLITKTKIITL